jgi:hypothetical protein
MPGQSPLDHDWTEVDVEITDADCLGAKRRDCYDDPVSRACRHALGWRFHSVAVDGRIIVKQRTGTRRHHGQADCLSDDQPALRDWIRAWDDGGAPETPMMFTLKVPPAWVPAPNLAREKNPRPGKKSP